jgi:hypothetical protein
VNDGTISNQAARALADLMQATRAVSATPFEMMVMGVKVQFVRLLHMDQREGDWESLHVLGSTGALSLGNIPQEEE